MEYRGELAGALARGNHAGGRPSREVARKIILFRYHVRRSAIVSPCIPPQTIIETRPEGAKKLCQISLKRVY